MNINLSPATVNFNLCNSLGIYKGAEWSVPVQICNREVASGSIQDNPVDITGLTGRCTIKNYAGQDQAVAIPDVEITDAEHGKILISLSAEATSLIPACGNTWRDVTVYQFDCYLDDVNTGESWRILQGSVEVSPCVTDNDDHE